MSDDAANPDRRGFLSGAFLRDSSDGDSSDRNAGDGRSEATPPKKSSDAPALSDPQSRQNARQNTPETRGPAVDLTAILERAESMNGSAQPGDTIDRGDTAAQTARRARVLRPPGARPEAKFMDLCTRCGDCESACPHGTIRILPERDDDRGGTPTVALYDAPCHMCTDVPCIRACEPDALQLRPPVKIGTAAIQTHSCLAHNRNTCSVCVERCPKPGAIRIEDGKPIVDPDVCSGCGFCQAACPAPGQAILIEPPRSSA